MIIQTWLGLKDIYGAPLDVHVKLQFISPGRKNQFLWSYKPDWGLKTFMVPHLMFRLSYNWLVEGEKINSLTIHIWCEEEEKHNLIWQKKIDYGPICCFAQFDVQTRSLQDERIFWINQSSEPWLQAYDAR